MRIRKRNVRLRRESVRDPATAERVWNLPTARQRIELMERRRMGVPCPDVTIRYAEPVRRPEGDRAVPEPLERRRNPTATHRLLFVVAFLFSCDKLRSWSTEKRG